MEQPPQMRSPEGEFNIDAIDQESWKRLEQLLGDQDNGSGEQNEKWAEKVISVLSSAAASRNVKGM